MSKKGNGSICYDKKNKSYRAFVVTPAGKRISKRFKTSEAAVIWKNQQIADISRNNFVEPSQITLGQWVITWLKTYKKGTVKQRTYEGYTAVLRHLQPLAGIALQDIRPVNIQNLYASLQISAGTIILLHKVLKILARKAFQLGMIQKNFMEQVTPPKYMKKEISIFSRAEIEAILTTAHDIKKYQLYYPAILLAATTGMRIGEVLGLRWRDVLFKTNQIYIRQELIYSEVYGLMTDTLKTTSSKRKISITTDVVKILHTLKANTDNIDIKQENLCFRRPNDTPITPSVLRAAWRQILKIANVPYRKFHVLRHTHATELLASGYPLVDASRRLGHAQVSTTYGLYGHAIPGTDEKIATFVQNLYAVPK